MRINQIKKDKFYFQPKILVLKYFYVNLYTYPSLQISRQNLFQISYIKLYLYFVPSLPHVTFMTSEVLPYISIPIYSIFFYIIWRILHYNLFSILHIFYIYFVSSIQVRKRNWRELYLISVFFFRFEIACSDLSKLSICTFKH